MGQNQGKFSPILSQKRERISRQLTIGADGSLKNKDLAPVIARASTSERVGLMIEEEEYAMA
jgi:hypothetical protein